MLKTEVLAGLPVSIWTRSVDEIESKGHIPQELLQNVVTVVQRLQGGGSYAAAHKCHFFTRAATWCGKGDSMDGTLPLPGRIWGEVNMPTPERGGGG